MKIKMDKAVSCIVAGNRMPFPMPHCLILHDAKCRHLSSFGLEVNPDPIFFRAKVNNISDARHP